MNFCQRLGLAALLALSPATFAQTTNTTAQPEIPAIGRLPDTDDGLPGAGPIRRYDWFRKLWAERRIQWSKQAEQDRGAVVFLGDSITQMWGDNLGNSFAGMKVANRGISGDTTRGVLIRLKEDVLDLQPRAVVLLIGTNDLDEKAEPETIAANLKLILDALKSHNANMPIILCQVFPSSEAKNRPAAKIKKLNQLCAALVKGDSQITFIETWPLFANAQGDAKPEEFPDLLHPNAMGYAKWAAALRPIFATLGFLETADDDFKPEPGFVSLFNGHDLAGWGFRPSSEADIKSRANWQKSDTNAPPWPIITEPISFNGQTKSTDARFIALHDRLVVTTPAEGRRIQQLWTTREFSNDFVLKLEFRATPNADSGVYIRGPQLQCRDYLIAGPYKQLKQYQPQDWNEMVVTVTNGIAFSTCNGEVLEAAMKVPAVGPIGVEGDRGQMEYRRIRIKLEP